MRTWLLGALGIVFLPSLHAGEVVVYGGTPGGIAAALSAARLGHGVVLVESRDHLGGMTTSGLGKSDVENRAMIGGLFKEFSALVRAHYVKTYGAEHENTRLCQDGYYTEPHVAERVFEAMLARQPKILVLRNWRLKRAHVENGALTAVTLVNRQSGAERQVTAGVFIDATYEGDLYAAAGARFRLGRESRAEFGEPHAGVVYFDYQTQEFLPGTTGAADDRLPAYTYRLCLTKDPANAFHMTEPPPGYDRRNYLGYFDDLRAGRLAGPKVIKPGRGYNPAHFDTLVRALSVTDIPNRKTDVNINPRPLGFPFGEENRGYIEGDDATRERICERHRSLTLGLLWFLQHDPEVPEAHRKLANELHLPKDEFADNGHFPWQLYVREGRRLAGAYTLTEHDITGKGRKASRQPDGIAVGEFPIDSFPARKRQPGDSRVLEGYLGMLDSITRPYEIPYRIMIPEKIDGVIVPVAASTTHVAFSSIRMEPTWMCLGQAAGVAAHLALRKGVAPRNVPIDELQSILRSQGAVLDIPEPPAAELRPNILFILADDLSWSDAACYGHPWHETPHLDRLAREGMRFTRAYAPSPICSASRAALLTGKTPARLHFEFVTKDMPGSQNLGQPLQAPPYPTNLPLEEITTAEVLAPAGYHSAFFGKWHLNMHHEGYLGWSTTHGPLQQGFAEGVADFGGHPYAYFKDGDRGDLNLRQGEFPPDTLTDKVTGFLQRKHAQPFFLQWSAYHVHDPIHTRCRWLFEKYRRSLPAGVSDERVAYAAMVATLDCEVGRVLDVLDATGQAQNTLIIFMSDNGGHPDYTGNAPHRGSKWNLYEGGIRVPFIARWPGRIRAGTVCDQPVHGCDLLPTFAEVAGVNTVSPDGTSIVPLLRDPAHELPRRPFIWHFPYYHPEKGFKKAPQRIGMDDFVTSQTRPHSAILLGHHKLLHFYENDRDELYDLATDPGETTNLATQHPDLAQQLSKRLLAELKSSGARFAKP